MTDAAPTQNRRQLADAAQGKLERAYAELSSVVAKRTRLRVELDTVIAREASCEDAVQAAQEELHAVLTAPEPVAVAAVGDIPIADHLLLATGAAIAANGAAEPQA